MENEERYTLTKEDIALMNSVSIVKYQEFRFEPDQLCYKNFSPLFDKAKPRQRGYIHGLSKKLNIDEYENLPYYVKDIRYLSVRQAAEVIDILIEERDGGGIF